MAQPKILIIYTGGTIGMIQDPKKGTLKPFRLNQVIKTIPSIQELGIEIHAMELEQIIDSSNVTPQIWIELAKEIENHYDSFDGFVVLHGSDTMAFSASALSFLLENLAKPVIFTGSQLPIGLPRTDARENLITALIIAAMNDSGVPSVPEVCIYFEDKLYRGNRTHKFNSQNFDAFLTVNYPVLAEAGVEVKVFDQRVLPLSDKPFRVHSTLDSKVSVIRLFPGLDLGLYVDTWIKNKVGCVVLETYGSGNGPSDKSFLLSIQKLIDNSVIVLNVTQCRAGKVEMGKYETSEALLEMGGTQG